MPGLSFFRNRAYDQQTGRWTQEDPIGVAGGLNLYQFNGNNPVSYSDPFGLKHCPPDCGKIHAVGAAVFGTIGAVGLGVVGAAGGTLALPGGGTVSGAVGLGSVGASGGAALGVATANLAEAIVDNAPSAMSRLSRGLATLGLLIGGTIQAPILPLAPGPSGMDGRKEQEIPENAPPAPGKEPRVEDEE
jgi:hypothetical protein